jgi:DNA repair protein RadA/Sms
MCGMAKVRVEFRCEACGHGEPKWAGRCSGCAAWATLVQVVDHDAGAAGRLAAHIDDRPESIAEIVPRSDLDRFATIDEVDRVLGGGLVPGSVTLVGGEPGIGKSTLLLQIVGALAQQGVRCLYVAAEESKAQVHARAGRLEVMHDDLWLSATTDLDAVEQHIRSVAPQVVVVDSVQTVADQSVASTAGSVTQVRTVAHRLVGMAKSMSIAVVLVGHVTKDGALAGPRVLEHVVDTVLAFEGDRHHALRWLRAVKHRYGPTDELGVFSMGERGLEVVADPSKVFLADRVRGVSGSIVVPTLDARRPLLVELQALVVAAKGSPRRTTEGVDNGRLTLLLAVLERRAGHQLHDCDVYALAVGGAQVDDPGADLALCLAVASALSAKPIADDVVACGEIGLGGELRRVAQLDRRLAEAARAGFKRAIVPANTAELPGGLQLYRAETLAEALWMVGCAADESESAIDADSARPAVPRSPSPRSSLARSWSQGLSVSDAPPGRSVRTV